MLARSHLAIMDFSEGNNPEQAVTENGEKQYNVQFLKLQKAGLQQMSKETGEWAFKEEHPEKPIIPNLPKNIA